jgi:hypothetical protein
VVESFLRAPVYSFGVPPYKTTRGVRWHETGFAARGQVRWPRGPAAGLSGLLHLEFELRGASLYSYWFA